MDGTHLHSSPVVSFERPLLAYEAISALENLLLYIDTGPTIQIMYSSFLTQKDHVKHWHSLMEAKSLMCCTWVFIFYTINWMLLYWPQSPPKPSQNK